MMTGIGTPSSQSRIARMMTPGSEGVGYGRSRRRPPQVASQLAVKAPTSSEAKIHNEALAALRRGAEVI
jgi:hypothetical protein